ncbi:tyrosine-type recombinase/integrase [Ralstonia nicotianae]
MLRNVTLLQTSKDGKATWRLLGPGGMPLESFTAFSDSLLRKSPFNTRATYCRHLAEFFDYLFEASAQLHAEGPSTSFTRILLQEIIEAYNDYLVLGPASEKRVAVLVDRTKPSPQVSPTSAALMHAPVRKFLHLSEHIRRELEELSDKGLRTEEVDRQPLLVDLVAKKIVTNRERQRMSATSMIAGVISGGPKLLKSAALPTVSPQVAYHESRAFPFDLIDGFIQHLPTYRDKTLYAFLAASGCRMHEALQVLLDDIDVNDATVSLRSPLLRANHPSYLALPSSERDKLAWKGRTTESTLLIEPFASRFFENLECYLRYEHIPHGLHQFAFQYMDEKHAGQPYFLSAATSRNETFKKAVVASGIQKHISGAHSLRHAYGTYLLNYFPRPNGEYGLPVPLVQQMMGHASVGSTLKYARHDKDLMKLELQHANAMVFSGAAPKPLLELKLEVLHAQLTKIQRELDSQTREGSPHD